ncbi:Uncharacterised protein [Klebsiella pneumoniae]|uniref:Uncharacterized protein n=1 Tax=Klebsiella pneumoniae TaxID=573 RepID=A0A2X3CLU2_KLEPN|nr:Uncharacterised protein [Klebsiella pneumoniae]
MLALELAGVNIVLLHFAHRVVRPILSSCDISCTRPLVTRAA